jgi:hypothetical protein
MFRQYIVFVFIAILFQACSSKQYFEPNSITSINIDTIKTPAYIKTITTAGATLEDNRFLDENGISVTPLKDGFFFLNNVDDKIISANKNGELYIDKQHFKFKSNIISASLQNNLLALVFADNVIAIYDIKTKIMKLKKYLEISYLNDIRVANPLFLQNVILFPSLDGKLLLVNKQNFEIGKIITIDTSIEVKNIILLKAIEDHIIVASSNVLASLNLNSIVKKDFFIQSYTTNDKYIFISTLDGKLIKLDKELNIIQSKKYKFAKFQAISVSDKYIFAIESQGYIVRLNIDFTDEKIDKIPFEDDEKTFVTTNKIYFEDKLLSF